MNKLMMFGIFIFIFILGIITGAILIPQETSNTNCKIITSCEPQIKYIEKDCNCSYPDCFAEIQEQIDNYKILERRFEK